MEALYWIWELLGRLHPLIVHFPIGLLVVAFLLELLALRGTREGLRDGIYAMVAIGAGTAVAASVLGWLLSLPGGYTGNTLQFHKWSGIVTAVFACFTYVLLRKETRTQQPEAWRIYRISFAICVLGLTLAGHFGASLTHGSGYLTEVLPWNQPDSRAGELLSAFQAVNDEELSSGQLDQLNLEVRGLFAHKCYKCHSTEKHEGELILDNEEDVFRGGENGVILVAGDAGNSEIIRRLNLPRDHEEAMPKKGKGLSSEEIALISLWIDQGAHWADAELKVFPEAEMALTQPRLPTTNTITHPIDKLVDQYFQQARIRWPDRVEDATFIRRAYLDVIGLLPSPDEISAFMADTQPDKRTRLVDELLNRDEAYAQHWLSFWNDLLRNDYSGTGFITGGRQQITTWLYSALQENWSYNQMVRALLNPDAASRGFIRGIQWRGFVNNSQSVQMQAAQNISQSLLGTNLKCASCHNSFVSNLTLDQAYGFASIFSDSTMQVFRCDKPTGRMAKPAFIYPGLGEVDASSVEERLVQLAEVVVQPANGRLYRTITNRVWDRLLGRGIVMPVDAMDNPPWSQDVLDWIAADFRGNKADLKHLIRQIMTSDTYQLASVPVKAEQDLLAHGYQFKGPARRRLSAEQFADAMSQVLGPVYHGVAFNPQGEHTEAGWIWHRERVVDRDVLPKPGKRYFRHSFTLTADTIEQAEALVAVDHSFTLYVNGNAVATGKDWRRVQRLDLKQHLVEGTNVLAIAGENEGELPNPAGVLFSLQVTSPKGAVQQIISDDSWRSVAEPPANGWEQPAFDDSTWPQVRRYASFNRSHWGQLLDFRHNNDPSGLPFARAALVKLDPFMKALGRPTRENVTTSRDDQATLLQALELTNGVFFNTALREGAQQWFNQYATDGKALVTNIYQTALGREPTRKELRAALDIIGDPVDEVDLQDFLWALFMLPEFQLIY
ncbi:MAG: DUF1549 domain-containing protein [Bacteroidota bacterium]